MPCIKRLGLSVCVWAKKTSKSLWLWLLLPQTTIGLSKLVNYSNIINEPHEGIKDRNDQLAYHYYCCRPRERKLNPFPPRQYVYEPSFSDLINGTLMLVIRCGVWNKEKGDQTTHLEIIMVCKGLLMCVLIMYLFEWCIHLLVEVLPVTSLSASLT